VIYGAVHAVWAHHRWAGRPACSLVILFSFSLRFLELFDIFISQCVVAGALTLAVRLNTLEAWADNKIKNKTQGNVLFER
jgi:hypothetical protein